MEEQEFVKIGEVTVADGKISENAVVLGEVEQVPKDTHILDEFVRNLKAKNDARVASCIRCGSSINQLVKINKNDRNSGYVCKICLTGRR